MMRYLLPIIFLVVLFWSCDEAIDIHKENNEAPSLNLKYKGAFKVVVHDSIKLLNDTVYTISYSYNDDQIKPYSVDYDFVEGFGEAIFNQDSTISIYPNVGDNTVIFTIEDCYGHDASATLNLFAFNNLPPVAEMSISYQNNNLRIDARESYDQDSDFGGTISEYEYLIGTVKIPWSNPIFEQNFTISNITQIKVRVKDNNGAWSDYVTGWISN